MDKWCILQINYLGTELSRHGEMKEGTDGCVDGGMYGGHIAQLDCWLDKQTE